MNKEMMENDRLINFWNGVFENIRPRKINNDAFEVKHTLDAYLKILGETSNRVLDLGTGRGYCLLAAKLLGRNMTYGLGIDPSINAINYLEETTKLSKIKGLEFRVGSHKLLRSFEDGFFDGIVSSNVLDVVPRLTSNEMIQEITRLLKPGGLFVLKINFYLTKDLIEKIQMVEIADNTFTKDGVIRGLNFTSDAWIDKFKDFDLIQSGEYQRLKQGPKDRVFMFKKKLL